MTTPNFSILLQLGGKRNGSRSDLKKSRPRRIYSVSRLGGLLAFLMVFSAIFTAVSYSSSLTSSRLAPARANQPKSAQRNSPSAAAKRRVLDKLLPGLTPTVLAGIGLSIFSPPPPLGTESIGVFASDCTTPQTDFDFTDTVCIKVTNAPTGGIERLVWGHTDGRMARETSLVSATQTDSMHIDPTSVLGGETLSNKGTWRVSSIDTDFAPVSVAYFTIHDPATPTGDLSVYKFLTSGTDQVNENTDTTFSITVANQGPDTAQLVRLTDSTPAVTTFVSLTQTAGPTFTCAGSDCTIASLAKGAQATFTAVYHTNGVASPTVTSYSASVSADTPMTGTATAELHPADNTASGEFTINTAGAATACTLVCPQNINANANTSEGSPTPIRGAHVTFAAAEPDGDCGAVTATPASGSFFPVGTTTVSVSSATGGGSCSFTVTVTDTGVEPPTISCPAGVEVTANNDCERAVTLGNPSTTGTNVTVLVTRSDGKPMYNCDANGENCVRKSVDLPFPAGITTVTWTATAHSSLPATEDNETGNASCTQTIIVDDVVAPTISASAQTASADASCEAAVPDFTTTATVSDNCACSSSDTSENCQDREPITVSQSPAPGTIVGLGPHTITLTANDGSSNNNGAGNTATTTTTFTVNDTTAPTVTAPADSSASADASCQAAVPDYVTGTTTADNCSSTPTVTQSPAAGTLVGLGPHTVTVTATDGASNSGSDTVVFTVNDTTAPVLTLTGASSITVECHTSFSDPGATSSDNCDSNVPVVVTGSVHVNTVGTYTLTYNGSDDSGNAATAVTRTVTVVDTTAPTITVNGSMPSMWPPNHSYSAWTVTDFVTAASDSCSTALGISNVVIEKVTSDETENGNGDGNTVNDIVIAANCKSVQLRKERDGGGDGRVYTITFKLTDGSGNVGRATSKVTVPRNSTVAAVDSGVNYTVNGTCP